MKKKMLFIILLVCLIMASSTIFFIVKDIHKKKIDQDEFERKNTELLKNDYFTQRRNKLEEMKNYESETEQESKKEKNDPYQKYFYSDKKEVLPIENISSEDDFLEVLKANMLMFFKYFNISITKDELNNYLEVKQLIEKEGKILGPSPTNSCIRNVDHKVIGCMKIYIDKVMQKILDEKDTKEYQDYMDPRDNGVGMNLNYTILDIPTMIIIGKNYQEPTETYEWYSYDETEKYIFPKNMHMVLLVGYDKENFYINDPLKEDTISVSRQILEESYNLYGRQRIILYRGRDGLFP